MEYSKRIEVCDKGVLWNRILILCAFSYTALSGYVYAIISRLPFFGNIIAQCFLILLFPTLVAINFFYNNFRRINKYDILFIFITVILVLFSGVNYPDKVVNFLLTTFPIYFVGVYYLDDQTMLDEIEVIAIIALAINIIYYLHYAQVSIVKYDMYRAYTILPHLMVVLNGSFRKKQLVQRAIMIIASLVGLVYILALGTRGPVVTIGIYFIILVLQKSKRSFFAKTATLIFVIGGILLISRLSIVMPFARKMTEIIAKLGMSTRALDLFIRGDFISHLSGRDVLINKSLEMIKMRPILGYGLWGEYKILQDYPHNYFIEVIVHFGVIIGALLIVTYIVICLTGYFRAKSNSLKDMILIMGIYTFVHGMVSGSYLQDSSVFFLLGLCVCARRNKKKRWITSK